MQNNYDFPVALQPIFLGNGQVIPNRQAVVRTDSMNTLGIVSNDYGLVKHANVIDTFREASKAFGVEEKIAVTHDGAHLYYEMLFPKVEAKIQKGDIVRMRMIVKNSYNGLNSLHIIFGAMRLVCLNGMVVGSKLFTFNYRHTKNIGMFSDDDSLDSGYVQQNIEKYIAAFAGSMKQMSAMVQKPVTLSDALFDHDTIALPQYLLSEAHDKFQIESDFTAWGYYNSLTYAITHKMKKESPARSIQYGMEALRAAERVVS